MDEKTRLARNELEARYEQFLREFNFNYDELIKVAAGALADLNCEQYEASKLKELSDNLSGVLKTLYMAEVKDKGDIAKALLEFQAKSGNSVAGALIKGFKIEKTRHARKAALVKLKEDPVQIALKEIEIEFHKVSDQFKRHGFGAEFCRKMHDKYPIILDPKTIPKLVTRLKKSIPL